MGFTQPSVNWVPCFLSVGTFVKLNAHFYLEPKLGMSGSVPLLLHCGFMTCRETNITIINGISLENLRFKVYRHLLSTRLAPHVDWAAVPFLSGVMILRIHRHTPRRRQVVPSHRAFRRTYCSFAWANFVRCLQMSARA